MNLLTKTANKLYKQEEKVLVAASGRFLPAIKFHCGSTKTL